MRSLLAFLFAAVVVGPGEFGPGDGGSTVPVIVGAAVACNDGIDNDSNGLIDYPSDPGCTSAEDTTEADTTTHFAGTIPDSTPAKGPYCRVHWKLQQIMSNDDSIFTAETGDERDWLEMNHLSVSIDWGDGITTDWLYGEPGIDESIYNGDMSTVGHVYYVAPGDGDTTFTATVEFRDTVGTHSQAVDTTCYDAVGANGYGTILAVSEDGTFANTPSEVDGGDRHTYASGADNWGTMWTARLASATDTIVFAEPGDWDTTANNSSGNDGNALVCVGTWDETDANARVTMVNNGDEVANTGSHDDWQIVGCAASLTTGSANTISAFSVGDDSILANTKTERMSSIGIGSFTDRWVLYKNKFGEVACPIGNGTNTIYSDTGDDIIIQANDFSRKCYGSADTSAWEHHIRLQGGEHTFTHRNRLRNWGATKAAYHHRGDQNEHANVEKWGVFADNQIDECVTTNDDSDGGGGATTCGSPISVHTQTPGTDEKVGHELIARNYVEMNSANWASSFVTAGDDHIALRGNIFVNDTGTTKAGVLIRNRTHAEPSGDPNSFIFDRNTFLGNSSADKVLDDEETYCTAGCTGEVYDNLIIDASLWQTNDPSSPNVFTQSGNSDDVESATVFVGNGTSFGWANMMLDTDIGGASSPRPFLPCLQNDVTCGDDPGADTSN